MSVTLSTTYKEVLPAEIVEIVDELVDDGHELSDVLTVLDYFGETYQENLKEILEMLADTGADNEELYDYLESQGIDDLEYFEKYYELMENYDQGAVRAFLSLYSVSDLKNFEEVYDGEYNSVDDFVENYIENIGETIPSWICVDYEATWNASLRFDYNEENGYYFRGNW